MEIVYVYQRLRKDFGRAPKFTDVNPDVLFEIMPNPEMMGSVLPAPAPAWVARAPAGVLAARHALQRPKHTSCCSR